MMKYTCFLFAAIYLLISSCKFNPNMQGEGTDYVQGDWEQDSILYKDQLLEYTKHRFVFTCDSFYATLETHAKVNRYEDSCFNKGSWKEYAKGNYIIKKDTLYLIGTFTKANFKQKISGCYRIGQYLPIFIVKKYSDNEIQLLNLQQHLPITLKLKNKIICNPKPL